MTEIIELRAGALTMNFEGGGLRHIRFGGREVWRRIYVAVRDQIWGTIPGRLTLRECERAADSFRLSFEMEHRRDEVNFVWHGQIVGNAAGRVVFTLDGEARADFLANRIGFCVLHPIDGCAGEACRVEHADGTFTEGSFPTLISPHQPFKNIRALSHSVVAGVLATVQMDGDVFEMEDQRNWTDASYKTYCTPLERPFPVAVRCGDRITQAVTLTLTGALPKLTGAPEGIELTIAADGARKVPALGLGAASDGVPLAPSEVEQLKALNLAHLRVDLHLSGDFEQALERATTEARALGVALEAAIFLTDAAEELARLSTALSRIKPRIGSWLVFAEHEKTTPDSLLRLARERLNGYDPASRIGSGTNLYFTEINRLHPPLAGADFVCYSLNPQVHATDDLTLVENLAAQAETVSSARQFAGGLPVVVTPVTLQPRFNPHRAAAEPPPADTRQASPLAAAWMLGSVKYLAESGAESVTYFETAGERGVLPRAGSPLAGLPDAPGAVFPLYHVLAAVAGFKGGEVVPVASSAPLQIIALALRRETSRCLLVANIGLMTAEEATISGIEHLFGGRDEAALSFQATWLSDAQGAVRRVEGGRLSVFLPSGAIVWLRAE